MESNEMNAHPAVTVLVRDEQQFLRLACADEWDATTMLAAVSSDPRSFRELGLAWLRYRCDSPLGDYPWEVFDQQTPEQDWLLIDLACQRLVSDLADTIPENRGAYQKTAGKWNPNIPVVWWNLPPWWQRSITSALDGALPDIPEPLEPVDFRGILYGRTMADALADRMLKTEAMETLPDEFVSWDDVPWDPPPSDELKRIVSRWHNLTVRVHADWLMAPREDLDDQSPRTYLHRGREWVDWEVEYRQRQWSEQKSPPRALNRDTQAYRHGPMGRDEVVIYFDLCREVIHAGWKLVSQQRCDRDQLAAAMYEHAQAWLKGGSIDGEPTPPAEIIESSRRHMPLLSDGFPFDCDCPLCRMLIDESHTFGPTFSGFDGHHLELDDEFAFSLSETRQEWEAEQESYRQYNEESKRKEKARKELGTGDKDDDDEFDSVWKTSFVSPEVEAAGVSTLTLGFRASELVSDLKQRRAAQDQVDALNAAFDSVRGAASTTWRYARPPTRG